MQIDVKFDGEFEDKREVEIKVEGEAEENIVDIDKFDFKPALSFGVVAEEAIILSRRGRGEDDLSVCLIGENLGVFYAFAKHGRKSKRRFLNLIEPPSLITAYIRRVRTFGNIGMRKIIIEKAEPETLFLNIKSSIDGIFASWYMLELTRAVSFSKEAYPILKKYLLELENFIYFVEDKIKSKDGRTQIDETQLDEIRLDIEIIKEKLIRDRARKIISQFSAEILFAEGFIDEAGMKQIASGNFQIVRKILGEIYDGREMKFLKLVDKIISDEKSDMGK